MYVLDVILSFHSSVLCPNSPRGLQAPGDGGLIRHLADRVLSSVTFNFLRRWLESTYSNTTQCANRTLQDTERYHCWMDCEAAPAHEDLFEDVIVVILFEGIDDCNDLKRQLIIDIFTNRQVFKGLWHAVSGKLPRASPPTFTSCTLHYVRFTG